MFLSLLQQFADEMVSLVAEDSESVIAFLGGCKKQLSNQETEVVIQRSQSRRQSQEKGKADSQHKVGETIEALEQAASRLVGPVREKAETAAPTASVRSAVKPLEEQATSPAKPPRRAEDVGKMTGPPAVPPDVARDSKPRASPPVKPRRRVQRSSEPEVAITDTPDTDVVPVGKFPVPAEIMAEVAPVQSSQEQEPSAPPEEKLPPVPPHRSTSTSAIPSEELPPPVPPHRRAAASVAPSEETPPPVPPHRRATNGVAPCNSGQPPMSPRQGTTQRDKPPPKPARGNFIARQSPPVIAPQAAKESPPPSNITPPRENSPNRVAIQEDSCLDTVTEEEETKYSHPGSPSSLSSQDSSRSEDEKRMENEKKFDTLSKQDAKVLQGRKERLKALKKKKDRGDVRLSCEDISGMQIGEWY